MTIPQSDTLHNSSAVAETLRLYDLMQECGAQSLGVYGELLARCWLTSSGYLVRSSRGCDLIAAHTTTGELYRVEVKTARRGMDGRFNFTLEKCGHTNHKLSDVVILLCVQYHWKVIPFVIPLDVIEDRSAIAIRSDPLAYGGKYSPFRQAPGKLVLA